MSNPVHPKRILIIRPSALGDVCRTVPVLVSLRKAFPDARIDWVVRDSYAAAIEAHPALSEAIAFPRSRFAHWWRSPGRAFELAKWFMRLRKRGYDLVVDCQGLGRSGLMTFASGAPRRVGLRSARELAWLGYNVRVKDSASSERPVHTVVQMLSLMSAIGVEPVHDMRLYLADEHRQWWEDQQDQLGIDESRYAILAPTSRWLSKRWPIERFGQLIDPLRDRGFKTIVVIGSPGEVDQVQPLRVQNRPGGAGQDELCTLDFVGKTNIGQTMAMIAGAGLVIANDSAPLHMAVGFQRPCIGLFGPTDPAFVGPYQMEESVVRGYWPGTEPADRKRDDSINFKDSKLGDRLMRLISTAAVLQQIDRVLASMPAGALKARAGSSSTAMFEGARARIDHRIIEGAA